ncbi:hypothetical protein BDV11DRAFT_200705 [Aspergillus similis]
MASTDQTQGPLLSSDSQQLPNPDSRIVNVTRHVVSHFGRTFPGNRAASVRSYCELLPERKDAGQKRAE